MSPERLRKECQQLTNRAKFMESQLEDAKVQLEAARAEAERNKSETQRLPLFYLTKLGNFQNGKS